MNDDENEAVVLKDKGIQLINNKQYKEALKAFNKTIDLKPDYYEVWFQKGVVLFELHLLQESLKALEKALEIEPNNPQALEIKQKVLDKQKEIAGGWRRGFRKKPFK